jgi:hypothetical protein
MAQTRLAIKHGLDLPRAQEVARRAAEHYLARFADRGLQIAWKSDTHAEIEARLKGAKVRASVDISPQELAISAQVPLLLLPFKAVANAAIEREIRHWAEKA